MKKWEGVEYESGEKWRRNRMELGEVRGWVVERYEERKTRLHGADIFRNRQSKA